MVVCERLVVVRQGFRIGQKLIVEEIVKLFEERAILKSKELEYKKEKQKELIKKNNNEIRLLNYKIKLLRHFADFIAWQVFQNDYYKARRFYSGNPQRPDLLNTNLQSVILATEQLHRQDESSFALISDLTSFIDIGDILLIKDETISIVECKEGDVQRKVFSFLDEIQRDDFDAKNIDYTDKTDKFFDQAQRNIKQLEKGRRAVNFLKHEKGLDPFSDREIKITEAGKPREYYFKYLIDLIEESKSDDSAYGIVEDILYIVVYRNAKLAASQFIFNEMVKGLGEKVITTDYLRIIGLPLKEPIFFKPIGAETIFDILFGRLKIFVAIKLDKLIELFNTRGVKARWLTTKETNAILDKKGPYKPFVFQNQGIMVDADGGTILGDSFLIYLMLDNLTPTSYVDRYAFPKK